MKKIYTTITVNDEEYKLKLTTQEIIRLEKKHGSLFNFLAHMGNGAMPPLETLLDILHGAMLKYNSNVKMNDVYTIYEGWQDEGHSFVDFIQLIIEIFKVSGFIPDVQKEEETIETEKK